MAKEEIPVEDREHERERGKERKKEGRKLIS